MHICLYLFHLIEQHACPSAKIRMCANSISLGKLGGKLLTIQSIHVIFLLEFVVCLQIGLMGMSFFFSRNSMVDRKDSAL